MSHAAVDTCGICGARHEPHCPNPACTWRSCPRCGDITDPKRGTHTRSHHTERSDP